MPVRIVVVVVQLVALFFSHPSPSLEWLAYLTTALLYSHFRATTKCRRILLELPTNRTDTSSCATEALVSSRMPSSMVSAQCPRVYGTRGWYQSAMIGGFSGGWWLESISPSVSGRWWHAHTPTPLVTPAQWSAALLVSPAWLFASPSLLQ